MLTNNNNNSRLPLPLGTGKHNRLKASHQMPCGVQWCRIPKSQETSHGPVHSVGTPLRLRGPRCLLLNNRVWLLDSTHNKPVRFSRCRHSRCTTTQTLIWRGWPRCHRTHPLLPRCMLCKLSRPNMHNDRPKPNLNLSNLHRHPKCRQPPRSNSRLMYRPRRYR